MIIGGPCVCPTYMHSDRGSEFLASLFQELLKQYQIRHFKSTPIHPTAQANNERTHRTIGGILKTLLHKYGKDFEEALPYAVYCINNGAIDGTSISPYEMLYGRKPADPNSVAATDNPQFTQRKPKMSPAEWVKMLRERMADVQVAVQLAKLEVMRRSRKRMNQMAYEHKYNVGDLVLRWTGNTKRGLYGKLAYTTVGPFEVAAVHPRNPDVYELRSLEYPDREPTRHHVRELCPYITREAHEQQTENTATNTTVSKLDPAVGDFLLLPYGSADFLVQVLSKAHGRVQVQFLNKKDRKKDPTTNLKLVWYRTVPSSNVFDEGATDEHVEVYQDKLTNKQMADGFLPWTDTFDLDEFWKGSQCFNFRAKIADQVSMCPLHL